MAANGLQITEGAKVYRTDQDDYANNGEFKVLNSDKIGRNNIPMIELVNLDGSRVNGWRYATPEELRVMVR